MTPKYTYVFFFTLRKRPELQHIFHLNLLFWLEASNIPLTCTSAPASLSCWILSLLGTTAAFLFHQVTTWFIWRLIFPVTAVMSSSCAFLPTESIWTKFQKQNVAVVQLSTCIFPPPWKGLVKPWKRGVAGLRSAALLSCCLPTALPLTPLLPLSPLPGCLNGSLSTIWVYQTLQLLLKQSSESDADMVELFALYKVFLNINDFEQLSSNFSYSDLITLCFFSAVGPVCDSWFQSLSNLSWRMYSMPFWYGG